jgi:hypothetical protein
MAARDFRREGAIQLRICVMDVDAIWQFQRQWPRDNAGKWGI